MRGGWADFIYEKSCKLAKGRGDADGVKREGECNALQILLRGLFCTPNCTKLDSSEWYFSAMYKRKPPLDMLGV